MSEDEPNLEDIHPDCRESYLKLRAQMKWLEEFVAREQVELKPAWYGETLGNLLNRMKRLLKRVFA